MSTSLQDMIHQLKCWPEYFQAVLDQVKPFEVRRDDRAFKVGDMLYLKEWELCDACKGEKVIDLEHGRDSCGSCNGRFGWYTGRECYRRVTYILKGGQFGIERGYVVMGIEYADAPECSHTPIWQDLSFDHEFGTEKGGNWVCSKCGEVVEEPE